MTIVPLKLRLSLYAAGLAVAIVALAAAVVPPFVYRHELQLLDKRLTLRADELFSHLEAFEGGAALRENVTDASQYIPVVMRNF